MAFPRKLKHMMMFVDGIGYPVETEAVTLPKLARKLEGWRGGGMDGPVKVDLGMADDMDLEHSYGGPVRAIIRQFGLASFDGAILRFAGTYQNDDTGEVHRCEIVMRGRHEEIDRGEQKPGEAGSFKVKTACAYYKEVWDGVTDVEIDLVGLTCVVGGVDRLAEHRAKLGLF